MSVLREDLSPLREAFNADSDRWRVVALVSPTCSECILGAEAVKQGITDRFGPDRMGALVIWIPMLPSDDEESARSSASIFPEERAQQFYDADQSVGWSYARHTFSGFMDRARKATPESDPMAEMLASRAETEGPQWDLYMLYAPGVRWEAGQSDKGPPMPAHWIRHCGRMDGETSTYWRDSPDTPPQHGNLFDAMQDMADQVMAGPSAAVVGQPLQIEILGFGGCPNTPQMQDSVAQAVAAAGLQAAIIYVDQAALPAEDHRRGWPAPTVLVNDHDLFGMPIPKTTAMGCRMYPNGLPDVATIGDALEGFAKTTRGRGLQTSASPDALPMVCTLSPDQLESGRAGLIPGLLARADSVTELDDGLRASFTTRPGLLIELAQMMEQERGCCRFLRFQLAAEPATGAVVLDITGPPGTRDVLRAL